MTVLGACAEDEAPAAAPGADAVADAQPLDTTTVGEDADPSLAYPDVRAVTTPDGALTLTLRGLGGPLSFDAVAEAALEVEDRDGAPVPRLTPVATFIHTSMGHGGMQEPRVVEVGDGVYTVIDIAPSMAGHWELRLDLGAAGAVAWRVWVL
jgi:hypothetical protein